jgi:hypothetical protein
MGDTSSPERVIEPFESGMPRVVLQLDSLWKGIRRVFSPLLTLQMGTTSLLDLFDGPFERGMLRLVLRLASL